MASTRQSFGEQAARFSLYAPFVVFGIGMVTARIRDQPPMMYAVPIVNVLLIIAGLILGIVALISTKQFGTEGILARAVVGVVLNAMVLILLIVFMLPLLAGGHAKTEVVGRWHMTRSVPPAPNGPVDITLGSDGSFELDGTIPGGGALTVKGTWTMSQSRAIDVKMASVNGKASEPASNSIGLGIVQSVNAAQLVLKTDTGEEDYDRVP